MNKRIKKPSSDELKCVCSLVNKIGVYFNGNNLQGEIYFKHSPKCKSQTTGTYEWMGAGFKRLDEPKLSLNVPNQNTPPSSRKLRDLNPPTKKVSVNRNKQSVVLEAPQQKNYDQKN